MPKTRTIMFGLLVALAAILPGPALIAKAEPRGAVLNYEVYVGGLHAVDFQISFGLDDDRFGIEMTGETIGVANFFVGWTTKTVSDGSLNGSLVHPERHRSVNRLRSNDRQVSMSFDRTGPTDLSVVPPADKDDRDPVSPDMIRGTIDPLSAAMVALRHFQADGKCAGTIPAFDGRRRYDIVLEDRPPVDLKPNRYTPFSGPAKMCELVFKRIAGFWKKDSAYDKEEDRVRPYQVWLQQVLPDLPPVPVRIESELSVGSTVIHLVRAGPSNRRPSVAALEHP